MSKKYLKRIEKHKKNSNKLSDEITNISYAIGVRKQKRIPVDELVSKKKKLEEAYKKVYSKSMKILNNEINNILK